MICEPGTGDFNKIKQLKDGPMSAFRHTLYTCSQEIKKLVQTA